MCHICKQPNKALANAKHADARQGIAVDAAWVADSTRILSVGCHHDDKRENKQFLTMPDPRRTRAAAFPIDFSFHLALDAAQNDIIGCRLGQSTAY